MPLLYSSLEVIYNSTNTTARMSDKSSFMFVSVPSNVTADRTGTNGGQILSLPLKKKVIMKVHLVIS